MLYLNAAESHSDGNDLAFRFFICGLKRGDKAVEIRCLGSPRIDVGNHPAVFACGSHRHFFPLRV